MEIDNLELKLKGKLPINRYELFELVSSWGRKYSFYSNINNLFVENESIYISEQEPNECYNLSNLDVSQIENMEDIFCYSYYNGDLSKWNTSSCKNMAYMFYGSFFNNDSLNSWNTSNVKQMNHMFKSSEFNGDISNWNIVNVETMNQMFEYSKFNNNVSNWNVSNVKDLKWIFGDSVFCGDISKWKFAKNLECKGMLRNNIYFENKYNNGNKIPIETNEFLEWFQENKNRISNLNVTKEELITIDDYLISFNKDINEIK